MNLLECKHLSKAFGDHTVLDDVSFTLPRGHIIGLLGQNGAGKTTLIKLINDLLTPTNGEILFDGRPIGVDSKRRIAYLPERTYLDKSMTVEKVLKFFTTFYDNFDEEKARTLLQDLDLSPQSRIAAMSKGMQEKLQLILVMSRNADLYILDEPMGGVDPATRDYILDTILQNFAENASVLLSTHLIADIERILDDVILLHKGKIIEAEAADVLRAREGCSVDDLFRRRFKC
ncbi:MAG: ABC transporter ATP-binding protein [Clostridia bacterium]|nr:ABC transporter ATP-binding protein [Clostridia bacterium]